MEIVRQLGLIIKRALSYGASRFRGKAFAAFLLLAPPLSAEEITILALGDSLTQGYGLPEAQGFVPQLEGWLRQNGQSVQLINAGVSGDTTAGGAARVEWSLSPEVDAMIVTLGANDFLRGVDPNLSRANLAMILDVAKAKGVDVLLVGLRAPSNFGPDYKVAFDGIYPTLAEQYGVMLFKDFFSGLGEEDLLQAQSYFQPDGIHPNAEGVEKIVESFGPTVLEFVVSLQSPVR